MYYVKQDNYVYQITDHLGNVRATISDTKVSGSAVVLSYADYYPFGMTMAGRNMTTAPEYRLAYQGQEIDKEVGGAGFYAFELRHYDARLGKWLSADPYEQHWSPYLAMSNNPISFIDPDGGFSVFTYQQEYLQAQAEYMWNNMPSYSASSVDPWFMGDYGVYIDGEFKGNIDRATFEARHMSSLSTEWYWDNVPQAYGTADMLLSRTVTNLSSNQILGLAGDNTNHVVVAGDTPYDLAAFYQTDVWAIARLNHNGGKTQDNGTFFNDIYANSGGDYGKYWEEGKGTEWMIYPGDVLTIPDNRPGTDINLDETSVFPSNASGTDIYDILLEITKKAYYHESNQDYNIRDLFDEYSLRQYFEGSPGLMGSAGEATFTDEKRNISFKVLADFTNQRGEIVSVVPTKSPQADDKKFNVTTKTLRGGVQVEYKTTVAIYGKEGGKPFLKLRIYFDTFENRNNFWYEVEKVGKEPSTTDRIDSKYIQQY